VDVLSRNNGTFQKFDRFGTGRAFSIKIREVEAQIARRIRGWHALTSESRVAGGTGAHDSVFCARRSELATPILMIWACHPPSNRLSHHPSSHHGWPSC